MLFAEIWLSCLDTCPFLGKHPTTLAGKTSPNFGKIRVASQPPTTAAWCFSSGARCKSYPCWDSISHSILYGRNICSPVKVQTHEYVMNYNMLLLPCFQLVYHATRDLSFFPPRSAKKPNHAMDQSNPVGFAVDTILNAGRLRSSRKGQGISMDILSHGCFQK